MTQFTPTDFSDLEACLQQIVADKTPVAIQARGTKQGFGNVVAADHILDVSQMSGIIDYEPEELIITAHAATPLQDIEAALAAKGQMLAFEPPHLERVFGASSTGSLGGYLMTNLSGPRRLSAGAARDFLLGFSAVSGRGTAFKSGSKVVKNVTGYDLSKLICGSFGTMAVIDEVTVKTLPAPETSCSVIVASNDGQKAAAAVQMAMQTSFEASAAAIVPKGMHDLARNAHVAVIRLEGVAVLSVADRLAHMKAALADYGHCDDLAHDASQGLWQDIRDARLLPEEASQIWRISVAPTEGFAILEDIQNHMACSGYLDWAGGLLWLACADEGAHQIIRTAIAKRGEGHASLIKGSEDLRSQIDVFQPMAPALAALNKRIQASFDPHNLLNPGWL
ncbi:MAG: FAD-binding protein [Candidatus Puniceispirillaceae bacterium]